MSNIDKDIEIVKKFIEETQEEYSETLVDGKVYRVENIPLEFKPTKELANSISNVLSDREFLQIKVNYYSKEYNELFDKNNNLTKELETYKKMADEIEKMEREEYGKLGSYVKDNSTPEKERIAGGISFIRRLRKRLKERNEVEKDES